MNYLAHIYLSGTDKKLQLGNFIGDAVKGSSYKKYPRSVAEGILLHRAIDQYTDHHPLVREVVQKLKPDFGRYAAVLADIFFDHLLASRFTEFSDVSLKCFVRRFYFTLLVNYRYLPERFRRFIWYFIWSDRLGSYASVAGIREVLEIMVRYKHVDISVVKAMVYLEGNREELFSIFSVFFQELQNYCSGYICSDDRQLYVKLNNNTR